MAGPNATKSIFLALGANFAIAVAKGVAAFITSSGSILSVIEVKRLMSQKRQASWSRWPWQLMYCRCVFY